MSNESTPNIGLAVNRQLGFQVMQQVIDAGIVPRTLLVPKGRSADMWTAKTVDLFEKVSAAENVIHGKAFREPAGIERLSSMELDYMISIHFPYLVPAEVLQLPTIGTLNLHPAYLPFNRGWHTPSWAIADGTPYGATLHWMDEGVDTGDIALQRLVQVLPDDTANGLYQRVLQAELDLFRDALDAIIGNRLPRIPQTGQGTEHCKADLQSYQEIDLSETQSVGDTLRKLRALTTNSWDEAACFEQDGVRYRVRVDIQEIGESKAARKAA